MSKKKATPASVTPQDILNDYSADVRALSEAGRRQIKELVPNVREKAYGGWRGLGYHHPKNGYFCAIFPQTDHIRLYFEHGVDLHDPDHLLEGDGKQVRYAVIRRLGDLEHDALHALIVAAAG